MFEIDKQRFGKFVAELRKEKGVTQKELAKELFISDKAISKWETGVSIPDTALLVPLANLLGVSVTELLMCEKMEQGDTLETDKVEKIVKTVITYSEENPKRAYQEKSHQKWIALYILSFLAGSVGTFFNGITKRPCLEILGITLLLYAIFGGYFCCFVKIKLPRFYDENSVNFVHDGAFRMNMVGVKFNNRNWKYIVSTPRISMCLSMISLPIINFFMGSIMPKGWNSSGAAILLVTFFCSIFLPMYIMGKKCE